MSNLVNLSIDLDTQNGRIILAAVSASLSGNTAKAAASEVEGAKVVSIAPDAGTATKAAKVEAAAPAKAASPAPAAKAAAPAKAASPAPAAKAAAPAKAVATKVVAPVADDFDEQDEEAQLETIKAQVTKHTKKGKTADIKALLAHFDAGRASELDPSSYAKFYAGVMRYGKGETVEAILADIDEDENLE